MTKRVFNVLLLCSMIISCHELIAQKTERATVCLNTGRVVSGSLVEATFDSLVVSEENRISEGCRVGGKLRNSNASFHGEVHAVSDSNMVLVLRGTSCRQVINFRQVKSVRVRPALVTRTVIGYDQIECVQMRKLFQEVLDSVVENEGVYGQAWTMGEIPVMTARQGTVASAGIPIGIIGAPLAAALHPQITTYWIRGDRTKYFWFLKRTRAGVRWMKFHRGTSPEIIVRAND